MSMKISYDDFVEKFKIKKTTDDCYTPSNIYDAVLDWCVKEYGIDKDNVVRPFYPGGDYETFDYGDDSVVVDNPPFSILSQITTFYIYYGIKFFLFAPAMTLLNSLKRFNNSSCCLGTFVDITYDNGAKIRTSFITNLEDKNLAIRTTPELTRILKEINKKNTQGKQLPKYQYPDEVLTSVQLGQLSNYGVDFRAKYSEVFKIKELEQQRLYKKKIFGDGVLLSKGKTTERVEAVKQYEERQRQNEDELKYKTWELSEREQWIIQHLGEEKKEAIADEKAF